MSVPPVKPFRVGSQRHRLLSEFLAGARLNRFQAEKLGAHALNSLVADFERLGLKFDRRTVSVPTKFDAPARVAVYWLAPESYALAARLLGKQTPSASAPESTAADYLRASRG